MRILLILCALLMGSVFSQSRYFKASTFHASAGISFPDLGPINTLLQSQDSCRLNACYGQFNNSFFSFGFGAEGVNERLVWQADAYIYAISNPGGRSDAFLLNILQYYYATARLGYVAFGKTEGDYPFIVYPYVGGGGGVGQLRLSNDGTDRFFKYNAAGYILDAGIAMNTYNKLRGTDQWLKFGGSIGYYFAPASAWSLDNLTPGETVPISPQGVYFRLTIGVGGVKN